MASKDYYQILGISREADEKTIKQAYRTLAKKYHPDTNQGNAQAAERFKEITEAYDVLSDPEKKQMYDRYGSTAFDGNMGGQGSPFGGGFREFHFGGGMDDIFNSFFGGAAGGFDFGRGQDVETTVKIPYATAVLGGEILLRTPDGKIKCKINEGTQSGTRIRLKGKGKPAPGNPSVRGDMYITIEIQVPRNINQAAKEKLMEYQRLV